MKKNYHLDELETFLSESADQHRMYPSDRVWRNIDKELHGKKRWPALTFGALLTGAIITAGLILIHPDKNLFNVDGLPVNGSGKAVQTVSGKSNTSKLFRKKAAIPSFSDLSPVSAANFPVDGIIYVYNEPMEETASQDLMDGTNGELYSSAKTEEGNLSPESKPMTATQNINPLDMVVFAQLQPGNILEESAPPPAAFDNSTITNVETTGGTLAIINETAAAQANQGAGSETKKTSAKKQKSGRWGIEYYVTPSYSYRYLSESKIVDLHLMQNGPIAPNLTNGVDNFVRHKPIFGMEAGTAISLKATSNLHVKAGLQLNMRGYTIEAYAGTRETSTILLNRGYYTDSIFAVSSFSNQGGYKAIEVTNRYWQVALPIGFDLKMTNGKKVQLYVAASIQPTYQFNNTEYILSNDYRNYVKEPSLTRHWNVNTAVEAFVSYKAVGLTWQLGPQIRYQLLSGTVSEYPIKEHLLDYGLKIGVVKTLK